MAFDVSGLTDYVKENSADILLNSVFAGRTIEMIDTMTGVKTSEKLLFLETTAPFQADTACSYNTSGTTTFSNRTITVAPIAIMETFCPKALVAKHLQTLMKPGSKGDKDIPASVEKAIMDKKVALINRQVEIAIWMGNTDFTWNTNLKQFDGLLKIIKAASASTIAVTTQASVSTSTVRGIVEEMWSLIPSNLVGASGEDEPVLFMAWPEFKTLLTKLTTDNLYHYTTDSAAQEGIMRYPGNGLKIVAVHGLGLNAETNLPLTYRQNMILTNPKNLVYGTDLMNEEEAVEVWYSQDDRNVKSLITFKAGTQIRFPENIVVYKNT